MRIVIIGAGGHGRVVLDILKNNHQFEVAGFLDSNPGLHGKITDGIKILGDITLINRFGELGVGGAIVAIGDKTPEKLQADLGLAFDWFGTIHAGCVRIFSR